MIKRELNGDDLFVIEQFFTPAECAEQIARSEQAGYEEAPISTGSGAVLVKEVRNNARVMIDDPAYAAILWQRAQPFLPARLGRWEAVGLNERLRYYRYDVGERFAPHYDGCFCRDNGEQSQLTFMVYLNEDFTGGETIFYGYGGVVLPVRPTCGTALIFVHRQLHEGAAVVQGRKYVLRSDVMYRRLVPSAPKP
jgi:predicted 2-oxoglutarate/Fe(II)-dependent dioxygenase YbiX